MALLDAEIARIKYELGLNVLTVGAVPYIGVTQIVDLVIAPNLLAGASTTSATAVTAATTATAVSLTLASATGFSAGCRVAVDVDDAQEVATVRSVSGSAISVLLTKAHPAGYPVTVESGETIVREILGRLRTLGVTLTDTMARAGIKRADDVEFFGKREGSDVFGSLLSQQRYWREELRRALGMRAQRDSGGASIAL